MERVLEECDRADKGFDVEAVHDLRVALRRCRSLADGFRAIDPDPSWKEMRKAGKRIFQELGELRDMQVMEEWVDKLLPTLSPKLSPPHEAPADPVATRLLDHIKSRESDCKQLARKDLDQFDRKQWRQWSKTLPRRAARVRPGSLVFLHLALEKWMEAYELHKRAIRTRSTVGWHELRIGIKHFRYTVENFLPQQHARWGDDLKELQDLLGEVHDLDVLWSTAIDHNVNAFADVESRRQWREKLTAERNKRLTRYREKMVGRQSLWRAWRAELPSGPQLHAAALSRLRTWAGYLDPDFPHSQRVAQISLLLYDGLRGAGAIGEQGSTSTSEVILNSARVAANSRSVNGSHAQPHHDHDADPRAVLQAAAFMHDVGRARGTKNHQKKSYKMIRKLQRPLGWSARELELAAMVTRYHRGALPLPRAKVVQRIELPDRPMATLLAGILRLSVALGMQAGQNGQKRAKKRRASDVSQMGTAHRVPHLEVQAQDSFITVRAEGYSSLDRSAECVAAARHLLETVLRRPVVVRALRASGAGHVRTRPLRKTQGAGHPPRSTVLVSDLVAS
jgi:CHAD domain-containing protein